ncbi:hypothetical protein MD484_g5134, partial [Candolleomyces efflorescens]
MGHADEVKAQLDALESQELALAVEQFKLECKRQDLEARRRQVADVRPTFGTTKSQADTSSTSETLQGKHTSFAKASTSTGVVSETMGSHFLIQDNEKPDLAPPSISDNSCLQLGGGHQGPDHTREGAVEAGEVTIFTDLDGTLTAVKFLGASACPFCRSQQVECCRTPDLRFRPHTWTSGGTQLSKSESLLDVHQARLRSRCENCIGSTGQPKCPIPGNGVFRVKECILRPTQADPPHINGDRRSDGTTVSRSGGEIKTTRKRHIESLDDSPDGITQVNEGTGYTPG